jgi:murein DD-endopeptidase MepM/ murein hydrolase activator NlpD
MSALIIKSFNNPVTSFLQDKVSSLLTYNIETQSVYQSIEGFVSGFIKSKNIDQDIKTDDIDSNTKSLPTSSGFELKGTGKLEAEAAETESAELIDNSTSPQNLTSRSQVAGATTSISKSLFTVPVDGEIGSGYGERIDPFTKKLKVHKGIDIEAKQGSSIKSAQSGEVLEAAKEPTLGNYIKLKHDGGYITVYAHCSQLLVKKGQKIKQGDIIAKVGNTGASIGAHLHFEIWKDGKAVDPTSYIKVPMQ